MLSYGCGCGDAISCVAVLGGRSVQDCLTKARPCAALSSTVLMGEFAPEHGMLVRDPRKLSC
jgi:hypothetical protein